MQERLNKEIENSSYWKHQFYNLNKNQENEHENGKMEKKSHKIDEKEIANPKQIKDKAENYESDKIISEEINEINEEIPIINEDIIEKNEIFQNKKEKEK